jgi:hypothetical protein
MNKYLISIIELIIFGAIAFFLGKNIFIFTNNENLVKLNYIFWIFLATLSVLSNFKLYLYFVSLFVVGVLFLSIFIHKIIKVSTFVEVNMNIMFWILFATFFIPICVLFITKRMLMTASRSQAPRGVRGEQGNVGSKGEEYFIESLGDRAYVTIITKLEDFFREILDKNEIDYDFNEPQLNNLYFKDNLKRICNSKQFIDKIIQSSYDIKQFDECRYNKLNNERKCSLRNTNTNPNTSAVYNDIECNNNEDCQNNTVINSLSDQIILPKNKEEKENSEVYLLLIRVKYWIRLILENNCEEDRKLRDTKAAKYYNLEELGYVKNFKEFHENSHINEGKSEVERESHLNINNINQFRLNSQQGREFLQDHFQTEKYWTKYNIKPVRSVNPFDIISNDEKWQWGIIIPEEKCP